MTDRNRRQFLSELGAAGVLLSATSALMSAADSVAAGEPQGSAPAQPGEGPTLSIHPVAPDTESLSLFFPIPTLGLLAVNTFLLRSAQPVLVDTGLAVTRKDFMDKLRSLIALEDLRWLWLTHTDADHTGSLRQVLAEAPNIRIVTSFLGMAKLQLQEFPVDRTYLINPGESLDVGDRQLVAVKPPTFDAPETTGFQDSKTRALFSADCFGALVRQPAENAADIPADELREGMLTWATVDAPWLSVTDGQKFGAKLSAIRNLEPSVILSSHLPPAKGLTPTLLQLLDAARSAPVWIGPDQAAMEKMLSEQPPQ